MKVNNILFIAPFSEDFDELFNISNRDRYSFDKHGNKIKKFSFYMPMGVLALAAWAKKISQDISTSILDCNNIIYKKINTGEPLKDISFKHIFENIIIQWGKNNLPPDIIGISLNSTSEYNNFFVIADVVKRFFPNALIIAGGVTASYVYEEIFKRNDKIDAIVVGEGELPLRELLDTTRSAEDVFLNCSAYATKNKDTSRIKPIRVEDLEVLPAYNFELLSDMDLYFEEVYTVHNPLIKEVHDVYIATSRGCVFDCYFCNTKSICGKGIRYFSDEYVFNTIDNLCDVFKDSKFNCVTFIDELLFLKLDRAKKFFKYCKKKGLYSFTGNDSFLTANKNSVRLIKETGPGYVTLPLESGSQRVLKEIIRKPIKLVDVPGIIKLYRDEGLIVKIGVLIGFPGETKQDIEDEIAFYKELDMDWLGISFATPFPGTDLYDDCVKHGYLTTDDISKIRLKNPVIATEHFTREYLEDILYYINLEVNFKHNYNMRVGKYDVALKMFQEVLTAVPDHAFALYYMAQCYKFLNDLSNAHSCYKKYKTIVAQNEFWFSWVERMSLNPID